MRAQFSDLSLVMQGRFVLGFESDQAVELGADIGHAT
jgi:hypothetical protein